MEALVIGEGSSTKHLNPKVLKPLACAVAAAQATKAIEELNGKEAEGKAKLTGVGVKGLRVFRAYG